MSSSSLGSSSYFTATPFAWFDFDNTTGDDGNNVQDRTGNGYTMQRWSGAPFSYNSQGMEGFMYNPNILTFLGSKTFTGFTTMFVTGLRRNKEIILGDALDHGNVDTRLGFSSGTQFYSGWYRNTRYGFFSMSTNSGDILHVVKGGLPVSSSHYQYIYWDSAGVSASSDVGQFNGSLEADSFQIETNDWRIKHLSLYEEALDQSQIQAWWDDRATHEFKYNLSI